MKNILILLLTKMNTLASVIERTTYVPDVTVDDVPLFVRVVVVIVCSCGVFLTFIVVRFSSLGFL